MSRLPTSRASDFISRVWTLLQTEIEVNDPVQLRSLEQAANDDYTPTKLVNLADEVVNARRIASPDQPLSTDEETRLRAAVERTLRVSDPVYLLLKRRLLDALEKPTRDAPSGVNIPSTLRTGRGIINKSPSPSATAVSTDIHVPGFEHSILKAAIFKVKQNIHDAVAWTQTVWEDLDQISGINPAPSQFPLDP